MSGVRIQEIKEERPPGAGDIPGFEYPASAEPVIDPGLRRGDKMTA
jgi:hypothetical protein